MNEILVLLSYLSEHPNLMGFIQTMGISTLVGMLVLPKSIDAWKHLKDHGKNYDEETDADTKLLVQQMSEQVNLCSEATRSAVHKIAETTDVLLLRTEMLSELLQVTDIKSLSAMLRKTILDMEGMVIASDHSAEKLGTVLGLCGDILRITTDLMSDTKTNDTERQLDEMKQLINNAILEIIRLQK